MRCIAKITFQYHEFEPPRERADPERRQWVLHLYRVTGNSRSDAGRLCRREVAASWIEPSVAITVEGLRSLGKRHIAVCKAVKQTCEALNRRFYLCGVNAGNRALLAEAGMFDGIDSRNIHGSVAALLPSLCNNPAPVQSRSHPVVAFQPTGLGQRLPGLRHSHAVL